MACATLKRSLELSPICSRPSKRRRFNLLTPTRTTPTPTTKTKEPSPFAEVAPRINPDRISISIGEELKRMQRRKKLYYGGPSDKEATNSDGSIVDTAAAAASPSQSTKQDKHLFTFRQVGMICERLLKEREDSLRELYDEVLNAKLAEQYDTFVKFTYDQIQKRFESSAAPSYLS